ncbi:hypothetical protein RUM43_009949 [Polyplax serrata]|uniref:Major facilitator superfamily (MFS) profile domain-containing protein n=1 Tax=Polyplax serrata TaxID=468196 RepID=A0AAN8P836_POLSC
MKIPDLRQDEKSVKDNGVADLDTAIKLTGFGKFNICLIAIGGMCFMGSGLEYGLHAYTLPYAKCDLKISTAQAGIVNAMFLAGSITCSVICGAVADTIGRKKVITTALFVGGISTILASFSPNLTMFAVVRFISGFMSGAPGCLIFSYAGEFLADKYRARAICTIGFCWTSAWLLSPLFSWIIIPSGLSFETPFFTYNTWRLFVVIVGGIPNIISGFAITYVLTETPKFLFVQGRQAEAIEILKMMYHKNTGNSPDEYPVKRLVSTYGTDLDDNSDASEANQKKSLKVVLLMMASQIKQIFNPPHLKRALLVSSIYFSNFFGYYGLGLWLPELFNRFQAYYSQFPEGNIGVCELSNYQNITMTSPANSTSLTEIVCENRSVNLAVFSNTFIIGAACCTGNLIAIFLTNKVGSRLLSGGGDRVDTTEVKMKIRPYTDTTDYYFQ